MVTIQFNTPTSGTPQRLVAEATLAFQQGPLEGLSLVGFSIWKSPAGELFVTVPSRAYGPERSKFYDLVRATEGPNAEIIRRFKKWILDEYTARVTAAA